VSGFLPFFFIFWLQRRFGPEQISGLIAGIVFHEFGHALCGAAVGIRIRRCTVGFGPILRRWRWGGVRFELRLWPIFGQVHSEAILRSRKGAEILFLSGGALGNILLGTCFAGLAAGQLVPIDSAEAVIVVQLLLIALTLCPGGGGFDGLRTGSDALQILTVLRQRRGQITATGRYFLANLREYSTSVDDSAVDSPAAPILIYWDCEPDRFSDRRCWQEMNDALQALLARRDLSVAEELSVLDRLLTTALILGDVAPQAALAEWSNRALELGGAVKSIMETNAAVQIQLGHYAEGKEILERLYTTDRTIPNILKRIFLAQAELGLGNDAAARKHLTTARAIAKGQAPSDVVALLEADPKRC
jgi:hypothetical protein